MRLRRFRARATALATLVVAVPAFAVGLSPLRKEGAVAGPAKAFYLTVINPYPEAREFIAYQDGVAAPGEEDLDPRAPTILPARLVIGPRKERRITVIVRSLTPGESRETRICAELAKQQGMIHARVCSTLVAHRLAPRG